jgi:hypothetical protein
MRRLLLLAILFAGCFHARETQSTTANKESTDEQDKGKQVAAPRPVGTTPSSILHAGAMNDLQGKLGVPRSGELDDRTRKALEKFQREHDLAATGLPDIETVRTLGLDPDDVFRTGSRHKKDDTAKRDQAKEDLKRKQ